MAYFAWAGVALLTLELIHFLVQRKLYDQQTKLFLAMLCASIIICISGIILTILVANDQSNTLFGRFMAMINQLTQFLLPYLFLRMSCLTARSLHHPLERIGTAISVVGCIIILSNPWTAVISNTDFLEHTHIGKGYALYVWSILALYFFDFFVIMYQSRHMKQRHCLALAEACLVMIFGTLLHNIAHTPLVIGFAAALSMAIVYLMRVNPYAYVDFSTQVFNADYFNFWLWERFRSGKNVYLLAVKLSELNRIQTLYHTDMEISQRAAETLWQLSPKHQVFRIKSNEYVVLSDTEIEHNNIVGRVGQLFSQEIKVAGHSVQCPVVLADVSKAETVCNRDTEETLNFLHFLLRQASHKNGVQIIKGNAQKQKEFYYEQTVERYMTSAMEQDCFEVWYQPIYSIREKRFVGLEALSRLHHPELGWINPELFIRLAVKSGQIFKLMPRQLHKICRFLQENSELLSSIENVKINLSPAELVKENYCECLVEIIHSYNLPVEKFQFEVTETDATEYSQELEHRIAKLQQEGIRFCLDDFGSGYANLSSILRLPFSVIKMDKTLLEGICENENSAAFYHSMVDTLHNIGYKIVSEGVETEQEAELLAVWNVDMIQGYYYSKPMPENKILDLVNAIH